MYDSMDEAMHNFYTYKKGDQEDIASYLQQYKDVVEAIEKFGGDLFNNNTLVKQDKEKDKLMGITAVLETM